MIGEIMKDKNSVATKAITILQESFDNEQISTIKNALLIALEEVDIHSKCTDLALFDITNDELLKKFIVIKKIEGMSDKSLTYYANQTRLLFNEIGKPATEITTDDIRIILAKKQVSKKWTAVTCNNNRRIWNSFFTWANTEGIINKNPMAAIKKVKEPERLKKPFTDREMELLRNHANVRDRAIIELLISSAIRVSELCGLDKDDIDLNTGVGYVIGKGDKEREIYLNEKAKFYISEYLRTRTDNGDALFLSETTKKRLQKGGVETALRKIGEECGIKKVHPHRFRRTSATTALERGMKIEQIQQMLGHKMIETTTMYAITNKKQVKATHERLMG